MGDDGVMGVSACRALVFVVATLVPAVASAQETQPEPERSGFMYGGSLGGGAIVPSCDGCKTLGGLAIDIHLGWMIVPRFALMYDGSGVVHMEDFGGTMNMLFAGAGQFWALPRLWVKGGAGLARFKAKTGIFGQKEESIAAFGAFVGVGYELVHTKSFALDLHTRANMDFYSGNRLTNIALAIGANGF